MDSELFQLIVWGKMGVETVGSVDQYPLSFLTYPIKIISPPDFLISSDMMLDHFSLLGKTFHFYAFWLL